MHTCVCVRGKDTHNVHVYLQAYARTIRGTYTFAHMWKTHDAGVYMFTYKTQRMCMSAGTGRHTPCIRIFARIPETPVYVYVWVSVDWCRMNSPRGYQQSFLDNLNYSCWMWFICSSIFSDVSITYKNFFCNKRQQSARLHFRHSWVQYLPWLGTCIWF